MQDAIVITEALCEQQRQEDGMAAKRVVAPERHCSATIPDRKRTLARLIHNKDGLSGACRTVLVDFLLLEPKTSKHAQRAPANLTPSARR